MSQINVLVTGGTGFLGSAIVSALVATKRYSVTAVDINPPSPGTETFSQVRYVRSNILDSESLQKVFNETRPAIVVHTVGVYPLGNARYSMKGSETVFKVNLEGTRNALKAAKDCGARGFVYTSSVTVVLDEMGKDFRNVNERWKAEEERVTTSYGKSKAASENLVLSSNTSDFNTCALRSAPIFGPNDPGCIPILYQLIPRGETPFIVGTGENLQDYVFVSNVADAHILAVGNLLNSGTAAGQAFFITNNEPVSARNFCIAVWKEFGHIPKFNVRIPEGLAWWLGLSVEWIGWATGWEGTISRGIVQDACRWRYVSIDKARRVLGYVPRVSLPEALRITCQHFQQQLDEQALRK